MHLTKSQRSVIISASQMFLLSAEIIIYRLELGYNLHQVNQY